MHSKLTTLRPIPVLAVVLLMVMLVTVPSDYPMEGQVLCCA